MFSFFVTKKEKQVTGKADMYRIWTALESEGCDNPGNPWKGLFAENMEKILVKKMMIVVYCK